MRDIAQRGRSVRLGIVAMFTIALSLLMSSAAHAALNLYADNQLTSENEVVESGVQPVINGGQTDVNMGIGTHTIVTYFANPGYNEVARSTTTGINVNNMTHQAVNDAHSRCFWNADGAGGQVGISCWFSS